MKSPRTDSEEEFVENIILYAMNERVVLTNVERAVDNAYTTYMREIINEAKGDFKEFKEYIIYRINSRRSASDLRNKVIRLAHNNPELREELLPLVRESSTSKVAFGSWGNNGKVIIYSVSPRQIEFSFSHQFAPIGIFSDGSGDISKIYPRVIRYAKSFGEETLKGLGLNGSVDVGTRLTFDVYKGNIVLIAKGIVKLKRANPRLTEQNVAALDKSVFGRFGWGVNFF